MRRTFLYLLLACVALTLKAEELTSHEYERICKGAVATLFPRPIESIHVTKKDGHIVHLAYVRESDSTEWRLRVRLQGTSIVWATAEGRWRTHPADEKLSYTIDRPKGTFTIRTVHADGSGDAKTFSL